MLEKVISGGQTGVDQTALEAAKEAGLKTGGWAPRGWKTLRGTDYRLRDEFGLREASSPEYQIRTALNVRDADATLVLAEDVSSRGELATKRAIDRLGRTYLRLVVHRDAHQAHMRSVESRAEYDPALVAQWIIRHGIQVLNVAGNSEQTAPGISEIVRPFLVQTFKLVMRADIEGGAPFEGEGSASH
jgi:hypothetical protein